MADEDVNYASSDYPPSLVEVGNVLGIDASEQCTVPGCTSYAPPKVEAMYSNPIRSQRYTHQMCAECANQYGLSNAIPKGSPMDLAWRLLKEEEPLPYSEYGVLYDADAHEADPDGYMERFHRARSDWYMRNPIPPPSRDDFSKVKQLHDEHGVWPPPVKDYPDLSDKEFDEFDNWERYNSHLSDMEPIHEKDRQVKEKDMRDKQEWDDVLAEGKELGIYISQGELNQKDTDAMRQRVEAVKHKGEPMDIAMRLLKAARPHALIDNFDLNMLLSPKSSARPKLLRRYFPHAISDDEIPMNELMQEHQIRQEETDYFPLSQTQMEYREKESPPIFANVTTDKVTYDPYWQDVMTGEPMDIAMRLLKDGRPYQLLPHHELENKLSNTAQYRDDDGEGQMMRQALIAERLKRIEEKNDSKLYYPSLMANGEDASGGTMTQAHTNFSDGFQDIHTGEPMDIAFQLLKTPVSPEAKRHKLEYDKKYQDNPKRVKYREELNRERRQRGVYGKGGKDMSHTKDGKIVPEDASKNRARHFKGRGTLKSFVLIKR